MRMNLYIDYYKLTNIMYDDNSYSILAETFK